MLQLKWVEGLNAPKGLGIYAGKLFVADIDQIVVVDLKSAQITKRYPVEGATFLNDIEVSKSGVVYVSDTFGGNAIYQLQNGKLSTLLKDERLNYPNGLKIKGDRLFVSTWGVVTNPETFETDIPGSLLPIDLKNKTIATVVSQIGNLDGLIEYKDGFIVSDWIAGNLMAINAEGKTAEIKDLKAGSADIEFIAVQNLLLVPQMLDGTLVAYRLK